MVVFPCLTASYMGSCATVAYATSHLAFVRLVIVAIGIVVAIVLLKLAVYRLIEQNAVIGRLMLVGNHIA